MRRRVDNSVCRSVPVDSDGLAKCSSGVHHGYFWLTMGPHCFLKLRGQPVTIVGMPITRTLSECAHRTVCTQSQAATPTSCSNSTDDVATTYISAQGAQKFLCLVSFAHKLNLSQRLGFDRIHAVHHHTLISAGTSTTFTATSKLLIL